MTDQFRLYGHSDDLVYFDTENLEGERMEFLGEHEVKLSNGVELTIVYNDDGEWRIDPSNIPEDYEYEYMKAGTHDSEKAADYSDLLILKTEQQITSVEVGGVKWTEEVQDR